MGLFAKDRVNILQEGWDELVSACNLVDMANDSIMTEVDPVSCTVSVTGKKDEVETFVNDLHKVRYLLFNI